jgi:4a-hydroxytetrahydrobiopterin dehydratase
MSDQPLDSEQIGTALRQLGGWAHTEGVIRRRYQTNGWRASLLVANAIGFICEAADHHADVLITWPAVTVSLSTHSAGGITRKDIEVAELIERQVTWVPGPGSALGGKGLVSS